jgi:hypothetical protein
VWNDRKKRENKVFGKKSRGKEDVGIGKEFVGMIMEGKAFDVRASE